MMIKNEKVSGFVFVSVIVTLLRKCCLRAGGCWGTQKGKQKARGDLPIFLYDLSPSGRGKGKQTTREPAKRKGRLRKKSQARELKFCQRE